MGWWITWIMAIAMGPLMQTTAPVTTGSVSGHVFDADTNAPLAGVKIYARVDRSSSESATTDAQGRYVFEKLAPGNRSIQVYDGNLGPSMTPDRTVTVVGGRDTQVDFHTRLFGEISGRVLDDNGNPVVGVWVTANYREYDSVSNYDSYLRTGPGELQLVSRRARALTDDQGRYGIRTLTAGRQYWIVASRLRNDSNPISDAPADPQARRQTLAPTYYPKADSIDTGSAIVVHSLEMRDGVDIRMRNVDSYCLEATLTESGVPTRMQFGVLDRAVSSTLLPSSNPPESFGSGSDGKIRLCDLYPGRFQLVATRLSASTQKSVTTMNIDISNKDVRNLVVAAIPPSTVSGEFVWDKQPIEEVRQSVYVRTFPSPGEQFSTRTPSAPGPFSLDVFVGSPYKLAIYGLDSHSYLKDVTYDGSSILNQPFVPSGGDARLRVSIGSDSGSITATVMAANGQPSVSTAVVIVPLTARTEPDVAATLRAGVTDENGMYRDTGLPPGKYEVFAPNKLPPSTVDRDAILLIDRTPEMIAKILRMRGRGEQVEVGSNGTVSVSLSPIPME